MGAKVLHGKPEMAKRHSVRMNRFTTRATSVFQSLVSLWRRNAALEPSGAAGWAVKVLHETPGMAKLHSVRMSRHEVWPEGQTRASESPLTGRIDERAMKGRDPKTPSRPSPCGAPRARVVPEP